jgi:hypothetical protein
VLCSVAAGVAAPACLERRAGRRRFFLFSFSDSSAAEAAAAGGGGDGAGMGTAAVCSPVALMMRGLPLPLSITPRRKRGEGTLDLAGALLLVVALLVDTDGIKRGVGARGEEKREEGPGGG